MKKKNNLFDHSIPQTPFDKAKEICSAAEKGCYQNIKNGEYGNKISIKFQKYINILLRHIKSKLQCHSKFFLLFYFRRIWAVNLFVLSKKLIREKNFIVMGRMIRCNDWIYNRITLAILKYGSSSLKDMQILSPRIKGTTGYYVPISPSDTDVKDLFMTLYLMTQFEETRYSIKRLGKDGKFIWKNREKLEFDIVLESDVKNLVDVYDYRTTISNNLLYLSGSWALCNISEGFPLPMNFPYNRLTTNTAGSESHFITTMPSQNSLVILSLRLNSKCQGENLGWQNPITNEKLDFPSWSFKWIYLDSIIPQLELYHGIMKKHLELHKRPGYNPEDLIFVLAAITQCQLNYCHKTNALWYQILNYGYSVWTEPSEILERDVLPEFRNLRNKYKKIQPSDTDFNILKSVIDGIKWDDKKYNQINILSFSPINLIFQIDQNTWLIDWSLMEDVIYDCTSFCGSMRGTVACLRGREFQENLIDYLKTHSDKYCIFIWWNGLEKGNIRFIKDGKRDVDIGIIVNGHLLIIEAKSRAGKRDIYFVGNREKLLDRWKQLIEDIQKVDSLSKRLVKEPRGKNFEIPNMVKWIVPILCEPFVEWIPFSDQKWWLYKDIPRACTPEELIETIERINNGKFPQYRLQVSK